MTQYSASAWEAEWTAAGTPKGPVVRVRVDMAAACQPPPSRRGPSKSPDKREGIARAAAAITEDEQRRMIAKFQPFVRVAAMSASEPARRSSPDHYGLRKHLDEQRTGAPRERTLDALIGDRAEVEARPGTQMIHQRH